MALDPAAAIAEMDSIIDEWKRLRAKSKHDDCSDHPDGEITRVMTLMQAAIERFAQSGSSYRKTVDLYIQKHFNHPHICTTNFIGILQALRADYAAGRLRGIEELVHADTFSDFLEMAKHLLDEGGYKDAAAVIAGSTMEAHLRSLCAKHNVAVSTANGPKKASLLNDELANVSAYTKGDQKQITAWLAVRNDAAHGHYAKYQGPQVALMIDGIRDFIRRVPA
jgi:hypothetical protein